MDHSIRRTVRSVTFVTSLLRSETGISTLNVPGSTPPGDTDRDLDTGPLFFLECRTMLTPVRPLSELHRVFTRRLRQNPLRRRKGVVVSEEFRS